MVLKGCQVILMSSHISFLIDDIKKDLSNSYMAKVVCTNLMSYRAINLNNFATTFNMLQNILIIFTAEYKFTRIHVTVHDPFYHVLYVLWCFIHVIQNYNCNNKKKHYI